MVHLNNLVAWGHALHQEDQDWLVANFPLSPLKPRIKGKKSTINQTKTEPNIFEKFCQLSYFPIRQWNNIFNSKSYYYPHLVVEAKAKASKAVNFGTKRKKQQI